MNLSHRILVIALRVLGSINLVALVPAVMPFSWMQAIHEWLGLGVMPADPIVEYLARSLSIAYAVSGGFAWVFSMDIRRNEPAIRYFCFVMLVTGPLLLVVDLLSNMPMWWALQEGFFFIAGGSAFLMLLHKAKAGWPTDASTAKP